MISLRRYTASDAIAWDAFVEGSKNGTFLLKRTYMDYHQDRFKDHSLLFLDSKERIVALLPANENADTLYSHQGLTYGGLITDSRTTVEQVVEIFELINNHARECGFQRVVYKPVPRIFHTLPADEDLYALFKVCDARLAARNISSSILLSSPLSWSRDRRYGANKAAAEGIYVKQTDDFEAFWQILIDNLMAKYGSRPVHSLEEIERLKRSLPDNILLYMAYSKEGRPLAGTVLYITHQVVHTQYISATEEGKHMHALDILFRHLLQYERFEERHMYFDFGTSNGDNGHFLHQSLIYQKQGFGGRAICYDIYEWDVNPLTT